MYRTIQKYICLFLLISLSSLVLAEEKNSTSRKSVQKKGDDFVTGADISLLQRIDDSGYNYKSKGQAKDALDIFKEHGFDYMRLRIFHSPSGKGPVVNSLDYTVKLAKRIKNANLKFLLDFHYSDTWADPAHQIKPKAWEGLSFPQLEKTVYQYTKDVMIRLKEENVFPDMVQIGNEITPGFIWDDGKIYVKDHEPNWKDFTALVKAGVKGVRDSCNKDDKIKIMIHVDSGGNKDKCKHFYDKIIEYDVPFDVIGLSYYPWWHGTMQDLEKNLISLSDRYKKDIYVVEAAYPWKGGYPDPQRKNLQPPFPVTRQGQADYFKKLLQTTKNIPGGKIKGLFYWAPEWVAVDGVGKNWANKAMFDDDGQALPVFEVFNEY